MEFIQFLRLMTLKSGFDGPAKVLWYPACGDDFRVLHHPSTNNVSIQNDLFILSDLNSRETDVKRNIIESGFVLKEELRFDFYDLPGVQCIYLTIVFENDYIRFKRDCIFLWGISNEHLYEIFKEIEFSVHTLFVKRRNDPFLHDDLPSTMEALKCRFYVNSFYYLGVSPDYVREAMVFAQNHGLLLRLHTSYQGMGRSDFENTEYVFVFEKRHVL